MKDLHIKKAYETLAILVKKSIENMSNASFAGIYASKEPVFYIGEGCHFNLRSLGKNTIAVVSRIRVPSESKKKITEEYYNWLFNDSPWSDVFVIKDAKEAIKLKGVICETNYPSNLIAGAIFATRDPWQYYSHLELFVGLIINHKKVNKNLAFISSLWCGKSGLYHILMPTIPSYSSCVCNDYQSLTYVKNFMNKKISAARADFCDNPMYKSSVHSVYRTWTKATGEVSSKEFINLLKTTFEHKDFKVITKDSWDGPRTYIGCTNKKKFTAHLADSLIKIQKGMGIEI